MSSESKNIASSKGNSFRREWDKEAFEKKAKERLDAELQLEEEREHKKTAPQPIVQRAPLQRRTEDLKLAKFVNTRQIVTGAQAIAGTMQGAYWCAVCECSLRDSANYLLHINGRKHNRMMGMSMRAERSTLGEVRARLQTHKQEDDEKAELSTAEKAEQFLLQFDERLNAREEEERQEKLRQKELRKEAKAAAKREATEAQATGEITSGLEEEAPVPEDMSMMGFDFGGFGGSKKNI